MLRTPTPTLRRRLLGASVVTLASLASAGFAWALQSPATPAPVLSTDSAMLAATPAVMDTITAAAVAAPMATPGVVDTIAAAVAAPVATPAVDAQHSYRVGVEDNMTMIPSDSIVNASPVESATDIVPTSVPGLSVQRVSPAPGAPARLRAYGASSPRDNDPIVMVDGVRASNINGVSPLDHLDPNRIKTIEVLKGPSAISRYGQDAENGVIVITTKQDGQP